MKARVVADRYEVREVLGREGSTDVVQAVDRQHDRLVALKFRRLDPGEPRDRVLAEGKALLGLRPHPSLPTVRDDFFLDDSYVLVMDWVDGTPLDKVVGERGDPGLPLGSVLGWLPCVAAALDHLHDHRPPVVHADVRPQNVLIHADGTATLVFGVGSTGSATEGIVSPYRMSELVRDAPASAADVYGLAAVTVFALTGQPPTAGEAIQWEGVPPELAGRLDRVLRRALGPDPTRMPTSAADLVEQLATARETVVPVGVVTFVLTDVEGSTDLWESHPEAMAQVMLRHHELAAEIAEAHGGRMPRSQGEGDSTLTAYARATDAVDGALAFQRAVMTEPWPEGIEIRVRVGLHTGEAQVEHGDYFGAAVSRAARLRGLARGGQILASQATVELVADRLPAGVELHELGQVHLKGLVRAEQVHQLRAPDLLDVPPGEGLLASIGSAVRLPWPASFPVSVAPFVGRQAELALLSEPWTRTVTQTQRRVVLVSGDPGIGKTRLAVQFAHSVYDRDEAIVFHGRCYEENVVPYQPFVEALEQFVHNGDPAEVRAHLIRSGSLLTRLVPDVGQRFPDLPAPVRAEPDTERYLMFEAVSTLLAGLGKHRPVLLVLDDLQWADRPTIALLGHLARSADAAPLLILGTYRRGEVVDDHPLVNAMADLRHDELSSEVALGGLSEIEVGDLITATSQLAARPSFVRSVRRETDGNPFFVQEICSHVDETGGTTDAFTLATLGVPDGVKQVIGRRIARLPDADGALLTVAAVIGREFDLALLVEVAGVEEDAAIDSLDRAGAARLVDEIATSAGRYSFVHALTREALYDSLSGTRRARLHRRVAEAIESRQVGDLDDHLGALAYHYAEAGAELGKAVEYARRAGDQALGRLAHEDAAAHYERGLALLQAHDQDRCDLLLGLGEARRRGGDVPGSQAAFAEAGAAASALGDAERLARAAVGNFRGHVLANPGWHQPVIDLLEAALRALPEDDSALRARVLAALSLELYFTPAQDRAITTSADAIATARRAGDDDALAFALACAHTAISNPDHVDERLATASELVDVGERVGNPELALLGHVHRGHALLELARVDEARREAAVALEIVESLGQPMQRYFVIWLRSTLALLEGLLDEAAGLSREALEIALAAQHPDATLVFGTQAVVLGWQRGDTSELIEAAERLLDEFPDLSSWSSAAALAHAVVGRHERARELLRARVRDLDGLSFSDTWIPALVSLTEVARMVDEPAAAGPIYERLASYGHLLCVVSLSLSELGPVHRSLGVLATLMDDFANATQHFEQALSVSEKIGAPPHLARTSVDYSRLLLSRRADGDVERAATLLEAASMTARSIGMHGLLRDAEELRRGLSSA